MNKTELHGNNPLQGVGLKTVLEELVAHYGFDILYAYLNMNCFKTNPSIEACAKFLKKTDWAREKVELFYLYQYKSLPKVSSEQFNVEPRERIVPADHKPGKPAELSIEDGHRQQEKREKNAASRDGHTGERKKSSREFNQRRNARNDNTAYKDQDSSEERTSGKAEPAFNPWDNLKPKKKS